MEIEKMSLAQIEAYLEEKKKVKPRATPESVIYLFTSHLNENGMTEFRKLLDQLDWTPPKQDYEMELIDGMPCLYASDVGWITSVWWPGNNKARSTPFNRDLVGKAVE